jgi:hypothetical protein
MYTSSQIANAARLAALDHFQSASNLLLDSTARLVDLYGEAGDKALGLGRRSESLSAFALFNELVPELFAGHLLIAGHAHEDFIRLVEAQVHSSSRIAEFAFDRAAQMSPPWAERVIDGTESMIAAGESTADELGGVSLKAFGKVEKKTSRSSRSKKACAR